MAKYPKHAMKTGTRGQQRPQAPANVMGIQFGFPFWPEYPGQEKSFVYALHAQLLFTQWLEPERFLKYQLWQLASLLRMARNARFYDDSLKFMATLPARGLYEHHLEIVPVLKRADVQKNEKNFVVRKPLPNHGPPRTFRVSTRDGPPIRMMETGLIGLWRHALELRLLDWHNLDVTLTSMDITGTAKQTVDTPGQRAVLPWSGPRQVFSTLQSPDELFDAFERIQPGFLRTVPDVLEALLDRSVSGGSRPRNLQQVCCRSDYLEPGLREQVEEIWGVPVIHELFVPEMGVIAQQCPVSRNLHIQSEYVFVEILDEQGNRCERGQSGRLVTTPLHNFQMPLIRYDTGIQAESGESCVCGRTLPWIFPLPG